MSSSIVERNHDNPNRVYSLRCLCCQVALFLFIDRNWNWLRSIPIEIDCSIHIFIFISATAFNAYTQHIVCLPIQLYFNLTLFNILALLMIYSRISNQFFRWRPFSMCDRNYVVEDACFIQYIQNLNYTSWLDRVSVLCVSNANEFYQNVFQKLKPQKNVPIDHVATMLCHHFNNMNIKNQLKASNPSGYSYSYSHVMMKRETERAGKFSI